MYTVTALQGATATLLTFGIVPLAMIVLGVAQFIFPCLRTPVKE